MWKIQDLNSQYRQKIQKITIRVILSLAKFKTKVLTSRGLWRETVTHQLCVYHCSNNSIPSSLKLDFSLDCNNSTPSTLNPAISLERSSWIFPLHAKHSRSRLSCIKGGKLRAATRSFLTSLTVRNILQIASKAISIYYKSAPVQASKAWIVDRHFNSN